MTHQNEQIEMTVDEQKAHDAFVAYADAKAKAEETMDFRDAMAAGVAWRTFINLFVGPENQMAVHTNVVDFPRHRRRS